MAEEMTLMPRIPPNAAAREAQEQLWLFIAAWAKTLCPNPVGDPLWEHSGKRRMGQPSPWSSMCPMIYKHLDALVNQNADFVASRYP
jgi:hypothetical protein